MYRYLRGTLKDLKEIYLKTHPRHCKPGEQPCTQEHTYACGYCGGEFVTDESTFFMSKNGVKLVSPYWPACSLACYLATYLDALDDDPNGALDPSDEASE